jgi:malate dehydrogenase (oxaloacetate-decarboxylating)
VVLAALLNAVKVVRKRLDDLKVVILGVGAAGMACTKMLMAAGVKNIVGCDRVGIVYKGRTESMNFAKEWFGEHTNPEGIQGGITDAAKGADLFLGLSGPNTFPESALRTMNRDSIVFALANPVPEIAPEIAMEHARIVATGRSDYPNQINNVLCFPGMFRGALDVHAREINEEMKLAAARAIAGCIPESELMEEYIIPSVFDKRVFRDVPAAVARAAVETGVARRVRRMGHAARLA